MGEDFIIYQVKQQDNLGSIASRVNMHEEDLKVFHNLHCGKLDKIWFSNLRGIHSVCVPTQYVSPEKKLENLKQYLPPKKYTPKLHAKKYSVSEIFEKQDTKPLNFQYDIELDFHEDETGVYVNTHQTNFEKEGEKPDDKISSLALDCRESISPIPFLLSDNGKISSIFQHNEIIKKFKTQRESIEDFHIGEVSKKYINLFEENISNESYFFKQIKSTVLFQILFPTTDWFHKTTFWNDSFFIYPNSFDLNFKFNIEFDDSHPLLFRAKITAFLQDNCSLRELLRGMKIEDENPEDDLFSEMHFTYDFDKSSRQLLEIDAIIIIGYHGEIYQKQHLHLKQS